MFFLLNDNMFNISSPDSFPSALWVRSNVLGGKVSGINIRINITMFANVNLLGPVMTSCKVQSEISYTKFRV